MKKKIKVRKILGLDSFRQWLYELIFMRLCVIWKFNATFAASKIFIMLKVGIIGGAGYTAGELIRLLLYHPFVSLSFIHSNSHAGLPVWSVHSDLVGETSICFTNETGEVDVLFLCLGHGKSIEFLKNNNFPQTTKIIDLSQDFRTNPLFQTDSNNISREFVYGLPECNKLLIKESNNVANPGCFATAFLLSLLPLVKFGFLTDEVNINAITGSTGAGQLPTATTHFSWRCNNISIYNPFTHRHLVEVRKLLETEAKTTIPELSFLPLRGNFTRGIFLSAYTNTSLEHSELLELYKRYYHSAPFTIVSDNEICLKDVVGTNKCLLRVEKHGKKVLITSVIDNLLKGASGQALQNMNIMCGFDETAGLKLKAIGF